MRPAELETIPLEDLRQLLAVASGILAQREGAPKAQDVLRRIADRLPGGVRCRS